MEIRCKKCNQKYNLPEDQVENKRVYFFCENCGHKIIIDRKKENGYSDLLPSTDPLNIRDLLSGIFYSFNMKNIN